MVAFGTRQIPHLLCAYQIAAGAAQAGVPAGLQENPNLK